MLDRVENRTDSAGLLPVGNSALAGITRFKCCPIHRLEQRSQPWEGCWLEVRDFAAYDMWRALYCYMRAAFIAGHLKLMGTSLVSSGEPAVFIFSVKPTGGRLEHPDQVVHQSLWWLLQITDSVPMHKQASRQEISHGFLDDKI